MIRRITFGNFLSWLHDLFHRYGDYGKVIDRQSQKIADLMIENGRLQMQLADAKTELTQTKEAYDFYYNAYTESLNNGNKNNQR
jgi:hypothetical protein